MIFIVFFIFNEKLKMTINELISKLDVLLVPTLIYFGSLPIVSLLFGWIAGSNAKLSPWKYIFSFIIYAVSIPAIFSFMLILYGLFFYQTNLLDVNFLAYFLPIISLVFTLVIISKIVSLDEIPGFERLSGLLTVIILAFLATFLLQRVFIHFVFFGSFMSFIAVFAALFLVFKLGLRKFLK